MKIFPFCCCLIVVGGLVLLNGCGSSSQNEYRVIDQSSARSARSTDVELADDANTDSTDDSAMMSVRREAVLRTDEKPVSALEYSNRQPELMVPHKAFLKDRRTRALQVAYDDLNLLKVLNMDPVTDNVVTWMPDWMRSLEGQTIRVRGYMYPPFVSEGLEKFILLRDNQECCYGPGAKIYDHIEIRMKDGTTARYVPMQESLDVVGRFKIDLQGSGTSVFGLYIIEDATVVPR